MFCSPNFKKYVGILIEGQEVFFCFFLKLLTCLKRFMVLFSLVLKIQVFIMQNLNKPSFALMEKNPLKCSEYL